VLGDTLFYGEVIQEGADRGLRRRHGRSAQYVGQVAGRYAVGSSDGGVGD
jgi:hypothetical protein